MGLRDVGAHRDHARGVPRLADRGARVPLPELGGSGVLHPPVHVPAPEDRGQGDRPRRPGGDVGEGDEDVARQVARIGERGVVEPDPTGGGGHPTLAPGEDGRGLSMRGPDLDRVGCGPVVPELGRDRILLRLEVPGCRGPHVPRDVDPPIPFVPSGDDDRPAGSVDELVEHPLKQRAPIVGAAVAAQGQVDHRRHPQRLRRLEHEPRPIHHRVVVERRLHDHEVRVGGDPTPHRGGGGAVPGGDPGDVGPVPVRIQGGRTAPRNRHLQFRAGERPPVVGLRADAVVPPPRGEPRGADTGLVPQPQDPRPLLGPVPVAVHAEIAVEDVEPRVHDPQDHAPAGRRGGAVP